MYLCAVSYFTVCNYAGSSVEFEAEADGTDKSQPFEIKTEDITEQNDKPRPYLCTVCDKRFTTKTHLNRHRQIHNVEKVYSCSECEESCSSQDKLRYHRHIHTGKYKCTQCGICCRSSHGLVTHRRSHSGEKPFECGVRSKRFALSEDLVVHSSIHRGQKPHKCHMCDKAFSESGNLNSHMRVHTGDNTHKCLLCNRRFSHPSYLHTHRRQMHSDGTQHDCPYCGKMFQTNSGLKRHVGTHTGYKPYSCGHCSERFTVLEKFKTHLLNSHNEGT